MLPVRPLGLRDGEAGQPRAGFLHLGPAVGRQVVQGLTAQAPRPGSEFQTSLILLSGLSRCYTRSGPTSQRDLCYCKISCFHRAQGKEGAFGAGFQHLSALCSCEAPGRGDAGPSLAAERSPWPWPGSPRLSGRLPAMVYSLVNICDESELLNGYSGAWWRV